MATRSILTNVYFREKPLAKNFVHALESAQKKQSKDVVFQKKCTEVRGEEIKKLFSQDEE